MLLGIELRQERFRCQWTVADVSSMVAMKLVPATVNWTKIMLSIATAMWTLREGFVDAVLTDDFDFPTAMVPKIT